MAATEADAELLLLDGTPDVQRKLKKAFCEPANVRFCPPIAVAAEVVLTLGGAALGVKDATYSTRDELEAAFTA